MLKYGRTCNLMNKHSAKISAFYQTYGAQGYNIVVSTGDSLPWVKSMRYLGISVVSSRLFKCAFDQAKQTYYHCLNAIFGKIGSIASEEVVLQLVSIKCLPILMYGTEACHMTKSDINSLDFAVN
jgi:hypothetical protein